VFQERHPHSETVRNELHLRRGPEGVDEEGEVGEDALSEQPTALHQITHHHTLAASPPLGER
jgi:hypothetical protein